jgi:hypothetical protein
MLLLLALQPLKRIESMENADFFGGDANAEVADSVNFSIEFVVRLLVYDIMAFI